MTTITKQQIAAIHGLLRKHGLSDDKAEMVDKIDRDFFDKIEAKLPDGYKLLREDIPTQNGDLIYAGFGGGWSLDNIVDESWKQSPEYNYPKVSFFKGVARAVGK